jgi:hypothetical protein
MLTMRLLGGPVFERLLAKQVERNHFLDEPSPPSTGNLFAPVPEGDRESGGWRRAARPATRSRDAGQEPQLTSSAP